MDNTVIGKLANGAVFQFGHNRDGRGIKFVKVTNGTARYLGDPTKRIWPNFLEITTEPEASKIPVTYLGREENQ